MTKVQEMADPKVPEHHLTPQGRIYGRVTRTDEKTPEVAPDFKGHGATPQQKEDENKSWISEGHTTADVDEQNSNEKGEPQPDVYAQRVNQSLGPLTSVKDKIADTLESGKEKISGSAHMASEAKDSTKGTFSLYTQAAWNKINGLKPTLGANEPSKQAGSAVDDTTNAVKDRIAEITSKGQHDNTMSGKASEKPLGHNILAAGGDDVLKVLSDGDSTEDDPLKANMRVTAEMLM